MCKICNVVVSVHERNVHNTVQEALEVKTSELASQRIAFEEEKLAQQTAEVKVQDSEAEELRLKLKAQVHVYTLYIQYVHVHVPYCHN